MKYEKIINEAIRKNTKYSIESDIAKAHNIPNWLETAAVGFEKIKKSSSEILSLYESLNDDFWDLIKAGCRYKAIPEGFKVVDKIIFADRVSEYNEYWSGNFVVIFKLLNSEKDILIFKTKLDQNYFQNGAVELQPFRNECSIEEYWTELKKLKTTFMSHLILNAHYKTKNNHEVLFYSIVNLFN